MIEKACALLETGIRIAIDQELFEWWWLLYCSVALLREYKRGSLWKQLQQMLDDREEVSLRTGQLSPAANAHLAECDDCCNLLSGYQILMMGLESASRPVQSTGFVEKVLVQSQPVREARTLLHWFAPLATAASIGVIGLLTYLVMKPAEQTPLTCLRMARLAQKAGIPDGVINVVPGYQPWRSLRWLAMFWALAIVHLGIELVHGYAYLWLVDLQHGGAKIVYPNYTAFGDNTIIWTKDRAIVSGSPPPIVVDLAAGTARCTRYRWEAKR